MLNRYRADFVASALTGLWLVAWRWALNTPWGLQTSATSEGKLEVGILYNAVDTWSYLSWVQQYYHGSDFAGLLYTTEPHAALLWLFPFWLIGHIAAWTGLGIIGSYNVVGLFGAMLAVFLFRRAADALRLPGYARNWATIALVAGSGGSWFWHLAHKLHLASGTNGGDLYFFDLFPSTAFLTYAYHAVGLALLAGLWWTVTETENKRVSGAKSGAWALAMMGCAVLLSFSRPYEPLAFMAALMIKTVWHGLNGLRDPQSWKASLHVLVLVGVAMAPGIGWTVWVSRQTVWSNFANESLALGLPRSAWIWTLAGWGILVLLGTPSAWRADRRLVILPLSASVLFAFILIVLGAGYTKLASGLIFGPIFLAGWGGIGLVSATARLPRFIQITAVCLTLGALLGLASFHMATQTIRRGGPALISGEMVSLARQLPHAEGRLPPIVLADHDIGSVLPGLVGARVWVGHWSLSPHYKTKVMRIREAGLDPQFPPSDEAAAHAALENVIGDAPFDYALLDRRCSGAIDWLQTHGWKTASLTSNWTLLRSDLNH